MFYLCVAYLCCSSVLQIVMSRDGCDNISCPRCSSYCVTLACLPGKGWKWPSPDTHDMHFSISLVYTMHILWRPWWWLTSKGGGVFLHQVQSLSGKTDKQTIEIHHTKSCYNVKTGWRGQRCAEADSHWFMRVDRSISTNFANWLLSTAITKN